jgi:hypothetical protein
MKVDTAKLTDKQHADLQKTLDHYNHGMLTNGELMSEIREYEKYTRPGGTYDQTKNVNKQIAEIEKILDFWENESSVAKPKKYYTGDKQTIPITESGKMKNLSSEEQANFDKVMDSILKKAPKETTKLSPKEAFKQGVEEAQQLFKTQMAELGNKFRNAIRGPMGDLISGPRVTPRGEYTEPAYRGLTVYPDSPNVPGLPNPNFNYSKAGAQYSTSNPMLADMYAGYLDTHPGIKVPEGAFPENSQVLPLMINTKDYHYFDAKGQIWQKANKIAIKEAKQAKKKGVIVDNVWDEPNSTTALGKPNKIYITFPEGASTVKSRFAEKFDPNSPNMMHGIGTIGIGTAATGYVSSDENE